MCSCMWRNYMVYFLPTLFDGGWPCFPPAPSFADNGYNDRGRMSAYSYHQVQKWQGKDALMNHFQVVVSTQEL